ncbi:MAG: hypothetical protein D5R99_00960 [Methanocalculus sp. MSAO_Arc1]|nr:MAG: hypothetical protein D5R99_00960 [Methanocalculus sp. MSAO_Arc1]
MLRGLPEQIIPRFLRNRLSGCSDEQGFISSVILLPSLDPAPRYPRRTCFLSLHNSHDPVVASGMREMRDL